MIHQNTLHSFTFLFFFLKNMYFFLGMIVSARMGQSAIRPVASAIALKATEAFSVIHPVPQVYIDLYLDRYLDLAHDLILYYIMPKLYLVLNKCYDFDLDHWH